MTHETLSRYNMEENGTYGRPLIFVNDEAMPSFIFPDFMLDLAELFGPPPSME